MTKDEIKKLFIHFQNKFSLNFNKRDIDILLNDWFLGLEDITYKRAYYTLENYTYHIPQEPNSRWLKQQIEKWEWQKNRWGYKDEYTEEDIEKMRKELLEMGAGNGSIEHI